jgi:hypothetical protein
MRQRCCRRVYFVGATACDVVIAQGFKASDQMVMADNAAWLISLISAERTSRERVSRSMRWRYVLSGLWLGAQDTIHQPAALEECDDAGGAGLSRMRS